MLEIILITGGCRSGKSDYAVQLAEAAGSHITFIATAEALDDEMEQRIARHQAERPAEWGLIEEPLKLAEAIENGLEQSETVIVDCLTLWVSNLLFKENISDETTVTLRIKQVLKSIEHCSGRVIFVTNEVGLGIVPADELTRLYRDCIGRVNQCIGRKADKLFFMISGIPQQIK
jgi:adenosylcobinamide kinase / adenosylcobinamide-phosphate guanylyltransferase